MEIRYEPTADEHADVQMAHTKTLSIYYAFQVLGLLFLVVGVVLLPKLGLGFSLLQFLLGVGLLLWNYVFLPAYSKRDFRKHPDLAGPMLIRTGEEGIELEGENSKSYIKWPLITRFRETPRVLMLYIGARNFIAVPKRSLSAAEQDQFRTLVQQKIQSN